MVFPIQNKSALGLALAVLAAVAVYVGLHWEPAIPVSADARAPSVGGVSSVPGGPQTPEYTRLQHLADERRANRAREMGGSAVPGRRYSNAEYEPEINEINLRYKLLKEIWDRTNRKRESYSPRIFIDWGMKHRDLAKIAWFDDARARGLLDDIQKSQKKLATEDDQKPLNAKEKSSLLKIIAGLSKLCYGDFRRGLKAEVVEDFEKLAKDYPELKIDKDILRNNFNEAWKKYLPNEIEKN